MWTHWDLRVSILCRFFKKKCCFLSNLKWLYYSGTYSRSHCLLISSCPAMWIHWEECWGFVWELGKKCFSNFEAAGKLKVNEELKSLRLSGPVTLVISCVSSVDKIQIRFRHFCWIYYVSVGRIANLIAIYLGFCGLHANHSRPYSKPEGGGYTPVFEGFLSWPKSTKKQE